MFQRFHEMRERSERGFTLIELLVVILIIAILAAIAIPVFLNQRKKGWASQNQSSLKNAATAMETIATESNGSYASTATQSCVGSAACTGTATKFVDNFGYNGTVDVTLAVVSADGSGFCLSADHAQDTPTLYYDSDEGNPTATACT